MHSNFDFENFPFEAVLWDMDGTLINSEPLWIEQERLLMAELGAKWSESDALHCVGGPMSRVDAYMQSKLPADQQKGFKPLELTGILLQRMEERFAQGVDFAPGAQELLKEMTSHSIKLALVTASSRPLLNAALRSIGKEYFEATISDDDVSQSKPHPEGYRLAASRLGANVEKSLIIEDSITGMTAAIASGAYVLGIPHFTELPIGPQVIHLQTLDGMNLKALSENFASLVIN
jgi:HAD superfamily hydrolase (TIGR01509 family)